MKWKKLGLIFCPDKNYDWMYSHAANPFAEVMGEQYLRIYFTSRNIHHQSHIAYLDMNPDDNFKILKISNKAVLVPGEAGLFDDSGTAMGTLLHVDEKKYLFYLGWNLKVNVPWLNSIGLAIFNEEKQIFEKYSKAPLLDRSNEDPFSISYPGILFDQGIYKMWYGSNLSWGKNEESMKHVIKYAESYDAIHWNRSNQIAVKLMHKNEFALSKPMLIKDNDIFKMWYSYRGRDQIRTYRIGYAESPDGKEWTRKDDEAGIDVSPAGWDSEMICYPFVFDWKGKRFMLYNGNAYGKTGFGLAVLESD
jgi:hypothetical protein